MINFITRFQKRILISRKSYFVWLAYISVGIILLFVVFKVFQPVELVEDYLPVHQNAWQKIKKHNKLIAITQSGKTGYYIYRSKPMGFQYEMLLAFCKENQLDLEIVKENDISTALKKLNKNQVQIVAMDFKKLNDRNDMYWYSAPYKDTRLVLMQRKKKKNSSFADSISNLHNQKVVVQRGTVYKKILQSLTVSKNIKPLIIEDSVNSIDNLLIMLANGDIDFTVCDEHVALKYLQRYHNLKIAFPLGYKQDVCWAVGVGQDSLLFYLNRWMRKFVKSKTYQNLDYKYYKSSDRSFSSEGYLATIKEGNLSPFDEFFRKEAIKLGWDWRLLASLAYEESHFNPNAESWSGAVGLMQLMPTTAYRFGAKDPRDAVQSLKAGVKYLLYLDRIIASRVPNKEQRIYFVLAAYNLGPAHIIDAINLAEKYQSKPHIWSGHVDEFLIKKSKAQYYNDEVVKSGYCNGQSAVYFVDKIFERFYHYKNLIPD